MSTAQERRDEARDEAREMAATDCIACAAGWVHDCDNEGDDDE